MKKTNEFTSKSNTGNDKAIDTEYVVCQADKIGYFNEVKELEVCLEVGDRTKWCDKEQFASEVYIQMSSGKNLTLAIHYAVFNLMGKEVTLRVPL